MISNDSELQLLVRFCLLKHHLKALTSPFDLIVHPGLHAVGEGLPLLAAAVGA